MAGNGERPLSEDGPGSRGRPAVPEPFSQAVLRAVALRQGHLPRVPRPGARPHSTIPRAQPRAVLPPRHCRLLVAPCRHLGRPQPALTTVPRLSRRLSGQPSPARPPSSWTSWSSSALAPPAPAPPRTQTQTATATATQRCRQSRRRLTGGQRRPGCSTSGATGARSRARRPCSSVRRPAAARRSCVCSLNVRGRGAALLIFVSHKLSPHTPRKRAGAVPLITSLLTECVEHKWYAADGLPKRSALTSRWSTPFSQPHDTCHIPPQVAPRVAGRGHPDRPVPRQRRRQRRRRRRRGRAVPPLLPLCGGAPSRRLRGGRHGRPLPNVRRSGQPGRLPPPRRRPAAAARAQRGPRWRPRAGGVCSLEPQRGWRAFAV